jgi:hypothetical protein
MRLVAVVVAVLAGGQARGDLHDTTTGPTAGGLAVRCM